jgi:hypothetical protein
MRRRRALAAKKRGAAMHARWTAVDTYFAEALLASDPDLEQALR